MERAGSFKSFPTAIRISISQWKLYPFHHGCYPDTLLHSSEIFKIYSFNFTIKDIKDHRQQFYFNRTLNGCMQLIQVFVCVYEKIEILERRNKIIAISRKTLQNGYMFLVNFWTVFHLQRNNAVFSSFSTMHFVS